MVMAAHWTVRGRMSMRMTPWRSRRERKGEVEGLGWAKSTARRCEIRAPRSWPKRMIFVLWAEGREKTVLRASRMESPMRRLVRGSLVGVDKP